MNLAQIRSAVRDILTAGSGMNSVISADTFWADAEIDGYINMGQEELAKVIRRARADYFTRILRNTDPAIQILGQLFAPSTLGWTSAKGNYQLPPDFLRMKLITDLSGNERVRVMACDIAKNEFRVLMNQEGGSTAREYLYDILGVRTLVIRPIPAESRDMEYIYEKRLPRMKDWNQGTVDLIKGNTIATFSVAADVLNRMNLGDELVVGTTALAPIADPSQTYPVVKSLDSATQVTLEAPYLDASISGAKFLVSPVSEIPENHHWLLVAWAAIMGFKKGTNPHSDAVQQWTEVYSSQLPALISDVEIRQGSDIETVSPFLEDLYDA